MHLFFPSTTTDLIKHNGPHTCKTDLKMQNGPHTSQTDLRSVEYTSEYYFNLRFSVSDLKQPLRTSKCITDLMHVEYTDYFIYLFLINSGGDYGSSKCENPPSPNKQNVEPITFLASSR